MTDRNGAGRLSERVAFEARGEASDGAGGMTLAFAEQFRSAASFVHLRGGEAVQAARLTGQHTLIIRVRASSAVKAVTTDWQIRDVRRDVVYAIRDIEGETDRAFVSFTCQSGAAS